MIDPTAKNAWAFDMRSPAAIEEPPLAAPAPTATALRALLDASPDVVSFKDRNRRLVYGNLAFAGWAGVRVEQIPGHTLEELLGGSTVLTRQMQAWDEKVLATGKVMRLIGDQESPAGKHAHLETINFPVLEDDGSIAGVATIARDVSAIMATESALCEQRELHDLAMTGSQNGIWDYALTDDCITLSERAAQLMGQAAECRRITPREFMVSAHPEDAKGYMQSFMAHLKSDDTLFSAKLRVKHPTDGERWLFVRGASLRASDGRVYRIAGSVSDITDQMRVERALRDSERRFIDFTRSAGDWFWETDQEHRFLYVSPNVKAVSGVDPDEYIGSSRFELSDQSTDEHYWAEHYRDLAARRSFRDFEYERTLPDGSSRRFRINGVPVFADGGKFVGYRGTGVDITEEAAARARLEAAESRLFEAMDVMADAAALFDADDRLVLANEAYVQTWCYPLTSVQLRDTTFEEILRHNLAAGRHKVEPGKDEEFIRWRLRKHWEAGPPFTIESNSGFFQYSENVTRDGGRFLIVRDITELVEHQRALLASEAKFRALYDENPSMFFTIDRHGIMRSVNAHGASQLGYPAHDLNDWPISKVHLDEDRIEVDRNIEACFEAPGTTHRWEVRKRHRNGETFWVRETGRVVQHPDGEMYLLTVCEDISEARRLSDELQYQATHDPLTGLVNRREFERRVLRALDMVRTNQSECALCYLDLDDFKVINDTSGHSAGDELLKRISALMGSRVRRRDTIARLGGDEFGILFEHCPPKRAEALASELREAIQDFRFTWEDKVFRVGASVGLVALTEEFDQLPDVFAAADEACYAAKELGGDRVRRFKSDDARLLERRDEMHWFARLNQALDDKQLRLAYQVIEPADLSGVNGLHYEMLVRMEDEDGSLIMPGAFLSAAERYNLLARIDMWVLENTLAWLSSDQQWLEDLHLCAVNLSGQSLGDERVTEQMLHTIERSPVPANKLCFEITETTAISNLSAANRFISQLRRQGVQFALDDFGSGLSSFAYLKNLPVDFLKIDGVFVRDIIDDPIDRAMVRSINEIGHVMGKYTVAEFVESELVARELRALGVDFLQGYHIAEPVLIERLD